MLEHLDIWIASIPKTSIKFPEQVKIDLNLFIARYNEYIIDAWSVVQHGNNRCTLTLIKNPKVFFAVYTVNPSTDTYGIDWTDITGKSNQLSNLERIKSGALFKKLQRWMDLIVDQKAEARFTPEFKKRIEDLLDNHSQYIKYDFPIIKKKESLKANLIENNTTFFSMSIFGGSDALSISKIDVGKQAIDLSEMVIEDHMQALHKLHQWVNSIVAHHKQKHSAKTDVKPIKKPIKFPEFNIINHPFFKSNLFKLLAALAVVVFGWVLTSYKFPEVWKEFTTSIENFFELNAPPLVSHYSCFNHAGVDYRLSNKN